MNIIETGTLLAKIQAFDNRNVDDQTTIAWQQILEPHTFADCLTAVTAYYRTSTAWIMPAHVIDRVGDIEADRQSRFTAGIRLSEADEASDGDWREKNRTLYRMASTGALTPAEYARYQREDLTLTDILQQKMIK